MKKERPILFSTEMVKAILDGRKTQTRRVVKPQPSTDCNDEEPCIDFDYSYKGTNDNPAWYATWDNNIENGEPTESHCVYSPYGKKGDVLWVREQHYVFGEWEPNGTTPTGKQKWTFKRHIDVDVMFTEPGTVMPNTYRKPAWYKRLARFMPKEYVRTQLEITNVRVERLQDITEGGAIAEGVEEIHDEIHPAPFVIGWKDYIAEPNILDSPYWSFYSLWCKINGAQSWKDNPWVWVVEFKRIERP